MKADHILENLLFFKEMEFMWKLSKLYLKQPKGLSEKILLCTVWDNHSNSYKIIQQLL